MKVTNKQLRKFNVYKQVAKLKGARVAKRIKAYLETKDLDRKGSSLDCLFIWMETEEGHKFWSKINKKLRSKFGLS